MPRDQVASNLMNLEQMMSMCFKALVSPWTDSKWLCTFLHRCALYGTSYEPSCVDLIYYTYGEAHWKSLANLTCILCTFSQATFEVYKTCQDHGNEGE
jgi:hypothetical protein